MQSVKSTLTTWKNQGKDSLVQIQEFGEILRKFLLNLVSSTAVVLLYQQALNGATVQETLEQVNPKFKGILVFS